MSHTHTSIRIAGLPVHATNLEAAVALMASWIAQRQRHYVCLCNVHAVVSCLRDRTLRRVFTQAGLATPDGMPLVKIMRFKGMQNVGRVYGPDLMLALINHLREHKCSHFLYGGAPHIAGRLANRLVSRYPDIKIAGTYSPPFRHLTVEEDRRAVACINDSGADVVWVGLGAPKQEIWMAEHRAVLKAPVLLGVGFAFDALAGAKRQAPRWMQEAGLEWAFRFGCEPSRLWPRIFLDGPIFLASLLLEAAGKELWKEDAPVDSKHLEARKPMTSRASAERS